MKLIEQFVTLQKFIHVSICILLGSPNYLREIAPKEWSYRSY